MGYDETDTNFGILKVQIQNHPKEFTYVFYFIPVTCFMLFCMLSWENQIPLLELEGKLHNADSILISDLLVQNEQL